MLQSPRLGEIAAGYGKSSAQVLIRWSLEKGVVTIPKSTKPTHVKQNMDVFDFQLDSRHVQEMDTWHEDLRVTWNPTSVL